MPDQNSFVVIENTLLQKKSGVFSSVFSRTQRSQDSRTDVDGPERMMWMVLFLELLCCKNAKIAKLLHFLTTATTGSLGGIDQADTVTRFW